MSRREYEQTAGAPTREPAPQPAPAGPATVLALQRSAGNHAVAGALADGPKLSPWRDFVKARGEPLYDYKIVNGDHASAGKYHLKFHNVEQLGVFDEIHVVFEAKKPPNHYFFTDGGAFIPAMSAKDPDLKAIAQELVNEQLATSDPVPGDLVEEERKKKAAQKLKDEAVGQENLKALEEQAKQSETKEAEAREASKASAEEDTHVENFLTDNQLGAGEKPALLAYLDGKGDARGYWKKKADWYKLKRDTGWLVTLDGGRVKKETMKKENAPSAASIKNDHGLPETAKVLIKTKPSGKYVNVTIEIRFPNYTTYAANKLGEKPPA
jgi:hypothetical protein